MSELCIVVFSGKGGSGKTALMARISEISARWVSGSVCVTRFMGTTGPSSNIRDVLVSVCEQIQYIYDLHSPVPFDLHVDFFYLVMYFQALIWRVSAKSNCFFLYHFSS